MAHLPSEITTIIMQFVKNTKQILQQHLIAEYLFGSYATNTYTPLSDIDILIIVDTFTPDIRRQMSGLASDYALEYDIYISPILKTQDIWEKNKVHETLFYQEVTQYGIPLLIQYLEQKRELFIKGTLLLPTITP
jgi:predicted nucleotidyltransferase